MRYVDKICKLFLLLVLFSVDLSAQTVITVSDYPVIDLSALNPLGAVLSSAEASTRRTEMNEQTPDNNKFLGVGESVSGHKGTWNAKMSIKFQVMRANYAETSADWATAYNQCKSYQGENGNAGQWRLPTQRELMMIWILHPQLIGKGGFTAFNTGSYWCSSERTTIEAWDVYFYSGDVFVNSKINRYRVRCVRDL